MTHIKNVEKGQIFHPFKSSSIYMCLDILGTIEKDDVYYPGNKIINTVMRVMSINLNTITINIIRKEFPHSVVRGMSYTHVPAEVDILNYKIIFDKIFK